MFLTGFFLFCNLVLLLFTLAILARLTYRIVTVQGHSMQPTFVEGDRVLAISWWPKRYLRKGQIVLFRPWYAEQPTFYYDSPLSEQLHIKRIVALAGETVKTSLNDIREEARSQFAPYHNEHGIRTWSIPAQHLFVCGDNHMESTDSLIAGPLSLRNVCGIVLMKLPKIFF
ncbi:MAG: signal peptidase I [Ktedonobacteraceae bacterium]|nr:signal peptidase I [Ktedonobacteraceae bacterium]